MDNYRKITRLRGPRKNILIYYNVSGVGERLLPDYPNGVIQKKSIFYKLILPLS